MIVLKFGGTSVGSPERMREVLQILKATKGKKLIVLSAMSGTTNALVSIAENIRKGDLRKAEQETDRLHTQYLELIPRLLSDSAYAEKALICLQHSFEEIRNRIPKAFSIANQNAILAQGELISTGLFYLLSEELDSEAALIPALEFMRTDKVADPDLKEIRRLLKPFLEAYEDDEMIITQGYICRNHLGEIDNLRRGGSDYSATILGAVTEAEEIQIWTDIDGIHNNDPRLVDNTKPIRRLSYREAAELAYFGAKILHPTCVLPAEKAGVPLRLKYTMAPDAEGTLISHQSSKRPFTAIAAKDGITAIKIYSHRMLNAYGFLRKVFQVFEDHRTSVDMITTSEVAVSLTIDDTAALDEIRQSLAGIAEVEIESAYSIICVVGNSLFESSEYVNLIFESLKEIPVRMISMGGSKYNVSILVKSEYKSDALIALNRIFKSAKQLMAVEG